MLHVMNPSDTRSYNSPTREAQAAETRASIVEALFEQLYSESLTDFSVPKVARRAGVSTRTVYRYFPTRDDLLAAVEAHVQQVAPEPAPPADPLDAASFVGELYAYFDRHSELIEAQSRTRLGGEVMDLSRARRRARNEPTIQQMFPDLDPRERLKRFAVVRALISSRTWRLMTREVGLSTDEATEIVTWAIDTLAQQMDQRSPPEEAP